MVSRGFRTGGRLQMSFTADPLMSNHDPDCIYGSFEQRKPSGHVWRQSPPQGGLQDLGRLLTIQTRAK